MRWPPSRSRRYALMSVKDSIQGLRHVSYSFNDSRCALRWEWEWRKYNIWSGGLVVFNFDPSLLRGFESRLFPFNPCCVSLVFGMQHLRFSCSVPKFFAMVELAVKRI